ncbi:MAG: cytochrome o ubiquinol oxidase subunit III [Chlamydiae bacterium]|nr:cytochrome o ubiquinol oxidase subunit III [Chlamydiota bacterium]
MSHAHTADYDGEDVYAKTLFGFWVYLFTDFMLFATLFATYGVLYKSTFGGPSGAELFCLSYTLVQTFFLLAASITSGVGAAMAHRHQRVPTLVWFGMTFLLGLCFMGMQMQEFSHLIQTGNSFTRSAFLSAFFTLVGTHTLHIFFGLLWILVLLFPVWRHGLTKRCVRRLSCLKMFWQFLNVLWIFIFSIVYLLGGTT